MQWGWNPETVTAVATAAATILAALAAFLAVLDVRRQRKQAQRRQATLVAAWTSVEEGRPSPTSAEESVQVVIHVANRSDLPVTNVIVTSMPAVTLGEGIASVALRWHSLGPGEVRDQLLGTTDPHDALGYPGEVLGVEFTDHAGRRWSRLANGSLTMSRAQGT